MDEVCDALDSLSEVEDSILDKFNSQQRRAYAKPATTAPLVTQKIYRVYVRHEFLSATSEEKAHFLIRLEGCILDSRYEFIAGPSFCEIFDKVKIQPDKRFYAQQAQLEWETDENFYSSSCNIGDKFGGQGKGINNQCSPRAVEFKLYGDKQSVTKILLHQSSRLCTRYEVSCKLREILLPGIKRDPTLQEVVVAVINYAQRKYLVRSRKNLIEFDENLKEIFGDTVQIPTSQIGDKLIEYKLLKPFRKIYQVDIPLNHQASLVFPKGESIYNDNSMSKIGGRVFDIEIDLIDVFGFDTQLCLNDAAAVYGNSEEYLSHLLVGAQFVSSKIERTKKELAILFQLLEDPLKASSNRKLDIVDYMEVIKMNFGPNFVLSQSEINVVVRDVEKAAGRREGYFSHRDRDADDTNNRQYYYEKCNKRVKIDRKSIESVECDKNQGMDGEFPLIFCDNDSESSSKPSLPKILKWSSVARLPKNGEQGSIVTSPFSYHGHVHAYQAFLDIGSDEIFQSRSAKIHANLCDTLSYMYQK